MNPLQKFFNEQLQIYLKQMIKTESFGKKKIESLRKEREDTKTTHVEILELKKYNSQKIPNNSMKGINSRVERAEERTCELEETNYGN